MKFMQGTVEGNTVAKYKRGAFTLICKESNGFYCVTFHNGRQTAVTRYSKDKGEMNAYIAKAIKEDGYRRVKI